MFSRFLWLAAATAVLLPGAAKKAPPVSSGEDTTVRIFATLYADREAIQRLLGDDLGGHYIVVDVRLQPPDGKELQVNRDDFLLRTDRDGERTRPFAPSQIAGASVLVLRQGTSGGTVAGERGGPVWGGIPGTMGRPERLPGSGGSAGNTSGTEESRAAVQSGGKQEPSPLLRTLEAKILPEKKISGPLSGLLYFPLEKQKVKDLEMIVTTPEGKISLRWK